MENLDLLKKDWNKENYFPTLTANEIYVMLQKKSSSVVRLIFIISIVELSIGIVLGIALSFTKYDQENIDFLKKLNIYTYYQVFIVFLYVVIVGFIIQFYRMYQKVCVMDNTKKLMQTILKTRRIVQNYILFNLVAFAFAFILFTTIGVKVSLEQNLVEATVPISKIPTNSYIIYFLSIILITAIFTFGIWLGYKILYGFLLKKLKNNYEELKKIDL